MMSKWTICSEKTRAGNSLIGFLSKSLVFCKKMSKWEIRSKNERFTHSLSFGERPERFAHSRSFVLSNLSKSLSVGHLIWAKWANEHWANERIPSPARFATGAIWDISDKKLYQVSPATQARTPLRSILSLCCQLYPDDNYLTELYCSVQYTI